MNETMDNTNVEMMDVNMDDIVVYGDSDVEVLDDYDNSNKMISNLIVAGAITGCSIVAYKIGEHMGERFNIDYAAWSEGLMSDEQFVKMHPIKARKYVKNNIKVDIKNENDDELEDKEG